MEAAIFFKYFFQFDAWTFNDVPCNVGSSLKSSVVVIGIEKTCGNFFMDVFPELVVLLCCITHRAVMRRLGLWKYYDKTADEYDNGSLLQSVSVVPTQSAFDNQATDPTEVDPIEIVWENRDAHHASLATRMYNNVRGVYSSYVDTSHLPGRDFYFAIFVSDFVVFFLTIVFWTSFSGDSGNNSNIEFLNTVSIACYLHSVFDLLLGVQPEYGSPAVCCDRHHQLHPDRH